MESCHSVLPPIVTKVPHPPPYHRLPPKINSTLGHLIEIIEQLDSQEKLSSVLQRIVAESDDTGAANGRSSYIDLDPATIIKVAEILRRLNSNPAVTMATETIGTTVATSSASLVDVPGGTPGTSLRGGERAQRAIDGRNLTLSKQDSLYLVKKIKDFEQKCKPLQEKNKKFLERNMELSTQNRNLKDQIRNIADENKKLKENLDQSKRKCCVLSRQLNQEKMEKGSLEIQVHDIQNLKTQVSEQDKLITSLKQASAEKDRRMEVLQHRKKRRLRMSAEHLSRLSSPCSVADDERSLDSDLSQSSVSGGTLSDDDLLEELPHDDMEKTEKNYRKLMKEHLALQKSMAHLQGILGCRTDPQRFQKLRADFETDMFVAQCKIENLEECLEKYKEFDSSWVLEKDQLCAENQELKIQMGELACSLKEITALHQVTKDQLGEVTTQYEESKEQIENLEFLVLETQETDNKVDVPITYDVSTITDELEDAYNQARDQELTNEIESARRSEASLRVQLEMGERLHNEYKNTINGLEEKLTKLLKGQGSEVTTVMSQLKQAEQHVVDVEDTMQELQTKIVTLQEEKADLSEKLTRYKGKLDAQEQSLSLTRDEREELMQVKHKSPTHLLNNRLKLAEMGHDTVRERFHDEMTSPMISPRTSQRCTPENRNESLPSKGSFDEDRNILTRSNNNTYAETQELFEKHVSTYESNEPVNFDEHKHRRTRINSVPVLSAGHTTVHTDILSEVDRLQKQISELQDENDVLKFELTQHRHGDDSEGSASDSEDSRIVELHETCENLRERLQSSEALEKQYKDRLKLAEKHITELEQSEGVLRDRVEEGNIDCDKLRKQLVRLQRKIRELKEVSMEREVAEQAYLQKLKYLEEAESLLSQKVNELEGTNQILKQRLDLKDELLGDEQVILTLKEKVITLETENDELGVKVIELEEDNEMLRDNWRKVADEEANRRECLEEKVKVLKCANKDLKAKLKEHESDLDLSSCPSIASEIHDDAIDQLNERIKELENELQNLTEEKNQKIESLEENLDILRETEVKLTETLVEMENSEKQMKNHIAVLEKSGDSQTAATKMLSYEDKITHLKSSQENLLERLDSMEDHEDDLKEKLVEMEKVYEKKMEMLEREIAEYQQQEEDLLTRIEELVENEGILNDKFHGIETDLKNKIEELENRETNLTVRFSQRVEELETQAREITEKSNVQECKLTNRVEQLESENKKLQEKVTYLEKHEKELSEKVEVSPQTQENSVLHTSGKISTNGATLELQNKVESFARVETEICANLKLDNQNDVESMQANNQKLLEEVSKLTLKIQESEKEQKSLTDKLKKQEKKRKKSQRTDNLDDYDTLAREVVTYKLEVEQLRGENNDLHDRIMELDESERSLLEKNEKMLIEMSETSKEKKHDVEDKESDLNQRIYELESTEKNLRDEISALRNASIDDLDSASSESIRQPSFDSAYESSREIVKETADKLVGTDDYMEGVMGGQEQGKPVSSMFERIQSMEAENLELNTKLSCLTATDAQVRQLSEKVKSLEENEDSLMERVMELEDEEDRLKRELNKARRSVTSVSDLEEELCTLHETEKELNTTIKTLEHEKLVLKKSIESSGSEKGDIAIRLASVQKLYEDEKKKVESLLKGEEKLMKSVSSEKKAVMEMEEELASTQEKLEELQTEYEHKLSEKDESEKLIKDEMNKALREKESFKKKLQEYEKSNNELEDEIEACKISESRMFHKHQQLITQNQELELKLSKLVSILPFNSQVVMNETKASSENKKVAGHLMSENPELIPENPLNTSIFTDTELELLRSKTPDTDLLGSVPLDMLRKIQEFDQRETNYQSKIQELENKNIKQVRKVKILQGREKDLKHEIKEVHLELLHYRESSSSLRASTSSLDLDKSGSDDGLDSDCQSYDGHEDINLDTFKSDEALSKDYERMTREQLLLSVKLFQEKHNQEIKKQEELEKWISSSKDLMDHLVEIVTSETLELYMQSAQAFKDTFGNQNQSADMKPQVVDILESVSSLRQRLEALQDSEERLRISLAKNELVVERLNEESKQKIDQLEAQIHVLAKLSDKYSPTADKESTKEPAIVPETSKFVETGIQSESEEYLHWKQQQQQQETHGRFSSPVRDLHLETSKTINIDVPPTDRGCGLTNLGHSETINVDVAPATVDGETVDECPDDYSDYKYRESPTMMDKAEDVLRQRIKELEKLEKHLKQQVHDLEIDRDDLHDIARKDKNIIHEQNVHIRELQLSQRNLQEQIKNFEASENSLYSQLDELENEMENKDDKIRHLEILEGRLKDLVKQYKLDEKILVTKSNTLETSVQEMTAKEETLKEKVQNLESEKSAFSERSEYLQLRLKELENAEMDLAQRAKSQENVVHSLQNTVIELETFGANAQSRVVELEQVNFELQQRLHHSMVENSPLSKQVSVLQQQCDSMRNEISVLRDMEIKLKQENGSLEKGESSVHNELKGLRIKEVELESKVRELEEGELVLRDKLSKLQRSENTLKYRVQELENSGIQAPSDLTSSLAEGVVKLPRTLEDCQRRIIMLQANNAELQTRVQQYTDVSGTGGSEMRTGNVGTVQVSEAEYRVLQKKAKLLQQTEIQMDQSDRLNSHLQETVEQLREGKDVCGHEVEVEVLRSRLEQANRSVKTLQNRNSGQWNSQGPNVIQPHTGQDVAGSRLSPGRVDLIHELVNNLPAEEWIDPTQGTVQETMAKTTTDNVHTRPPGQMLSRDRILTDLMKSLQAPGPDGSEDEHWREIESRMEANSRGSEKWIHVGKATSMYAADQSVQPHLNRSHGKDEELELGLALQSETESQLYSQNDTDSGRRYGDSVTTQQLQQRHNQELHTRLNGNSTESQAPPLPQAGPQGAGNFKVTDSFGESLYVPSSAQDSTEDYSDQNKEVLLRRGGQQGSLSHMTRTSVPSVVDSVADSGRGTASVSMATSAMTLRERIAYIERQLSARESDSTREFNSEIDLTSWKAKVHDSNRKLEMAEKENKFFKDEINKLEKDLEEKTRLYLLLEGFLRAVESVLADKNMMDSKDIVSRLVKEVENVKSNMSDGGCRPVDITLDAAALGTELAKKDRELVAKRNEADSLMRELRQWQQECRAIEDMRSNALDSLRGLEVEVSELQVADKQLKELKDDYNTLKGQFLKLVDGYVQLEIIRQKYEDVNKEKDNLDIEVTGLRSKVALLEGQIDVLEDVHKEKGSLEDKMSSMKEKLLQYEKVEVERNVLEMNLKGVTELLNERMKKVENLTEEAFELRKKFSNIDRDYYKLRQQSLNAGTETASLQSNNRTGNGDTDRSISPAVAASLKARVVQLTNSCNEKDMLIKKLVQELKKFKSGSKSSPLLDELCRLDMTSDHNHNRLVHSSSQSSIESGGEHISYLSDTELLHSSSPQLSPRPRSADMSNHRNLGHRHSNHGGHSSHLPRVYNNHGNSLPHRGSVLTNSGRSKKLNHLSPSQNRSYDGLNGMDNNQTSLYVAIADYDPSFFSQSGHQRLELSLKEGDIVTVTGSVDQNGYYEGEVNGHVGLVPANYLQPATPAQRVGAGTQHGVPQYLNKTPERIAQMYSHLHSAHRPDTHVPFTFLGEVESEKMLQEIIKIENLKTDSTYDDCNNIKNEKLESDKPTEALPSHTSTTNGVHNGSFELQSSTKFIHHSMASSPPQVPSNFHVEKIIGNSSLMLAWQQLPLDGNGCNNGDKVTGYRVFKNTKILVQPRGPLATKAVIENIDIHGHHRFGIQTVTGSGMVSELSEIMYEGVEEVTSDENSDTESEMDMSTVLDMDEYQNGTKRMFLSVYDYDPTKNSPQDHANCELTFNAGDTIAVYGRQRSDGFYHGEINGVRGLVPAFFIEEIPQAPPRTKKNVTRSKQSSKNSKANYDNRHES